MTSFIKAKPKKSDDQTRRILTNEKAANFTEFPNIKITLSKNHHSKIHDDKAIISCKNVKINMYKMDIRTF